MRKFDLYYQMNPNIKEKNPLKDLDFISNINAKNAISVNNTRDIMDDIVAIKRLADYINKSFHDLYNQTTTAIDYYNSEDGLEDFQEFMRNLAPHYYDADYIERIIEEWYYNEELKFLELGPEGYEALYNPPEEEPEILPYTFESLLWDFYMIWFEIWIACGLYMLARPDLIDMEDTIRFNIELGFLKIHEFFYGKPKDPDEIIFEELMFYINEMNQRAQGQSATEMQMVATNPSNLQVLYSACKAIIQDQWHKFVDFIQKSI
jgi:hypothetical protein